LSCLVRSRLLPTLAGNGGDEAEMKISSSSVEFMIVVAGVIDQEGNGSRDVAGAHLSS
jgi:hypothetical protein